MLLKKTKAELESEAVQVLAQDGVITNLTPGGRVRSIISAYATISGRVMDALDANTAMGFATSATGYFLDLWGQLVGIDRGAAEAPTVSRDDRVIKFSASSGVLKDHIPTGVIAAGTTITTADGDITYTVDANTAFPDDAIDVYVSATCSTVGVTGRVGKGMLTTHNLGLANVTVTNSREITSGANQETDDNFRFRVLNHWAARATANHVALRLAALSTPGVADAIIRRHFQGPGTVDILITPTGNRVTESTLFGARARVQAVTAGGDAVTVRGPRYVAVTMKTRVDFTRTTPDSNMPDIRDRVREAQTNYLAEIPLGGQLVMQELRARTQEASGSILDHEILCFGVDGRPQILRNWRLFEDELFIPDDSVDTPIQVV